MTPGPARVAMFHTSYSEPGGEDLSVAVDTALLRQRGVDVLEFRANNADSFGSAPVRNAAALLRSHFSSRTYDRVRAFCRQHRPDVAHVQNFWYALSPSVHAACHAEGVPTVQTLRNYRLLCVNALLLRDAVPCEACVGKTPWRGVLHGCYRESRAASALVARMIVHNRRRRTWHQDVDLFVALTPFARSRHVLGGIPEDRIVVRPNTVLDPGCSHGTGAGAVFVGRLSAEKGIDLLLQAWDGLPQVPLTIVGDGPLREQVERAAARAANITSTGRLPNAECLQAIRDSAALVLTSRWYEGFPRVIVEALALGRPVIAPRLGSMADLIRHEETGWLYEPGSAADLRRCIHALEHDPARARDMGAAARAQYETCYAPEPNAAQLLEIYRCAAERFQSRQ